MLRAQADRHGFLVLAPQSQAHSWDLIASAYGPDVQQLDQALEAVFARFDVGPLAISGFSDGGSYALSLGLINGALFGHILAFSPGFAAPCAADGRPSIFISHGSRDRVLPIERCGRRVAHTLAREGFDVDYREFDGGHEVPAAMADAAVTGWLDAPQPQPPRGPG
jgi:phospholipase/carboxylesterase